MSGRLGAYVIHMKKLPLVAPEGKTDTREAVRTNGGFAFIFRRAKWVTLLLLVLFALFMLFFFRDSINYENFLFLVRDLDAEYGADAGDTPVGVTYDADSEMICRVFKDYLIMVDTAHVNLYGLSGYSVFSYPHSYLNPAVSVSENYFAVYELGGYQLAIYSAVGELYRSKTYSFPITDVCIADDGTFAVVTKSDTYSSVVQVFDNRFNHVASYNTMRYVTKVLLTDGAKTLMMASVYVKTGVPRMVLQAYPVGDTEEDFYLEYPEDDDAIGTLFTSAALPMNVAALTDKRVAVLCDSGVAFCTSGGDLEAFYSFVSNRPAAAGGLSTAVFGDGKMALLFNDRVNDGISHLAVLDSGGSHVYGDGGYITVHDRIRTADFYEGTLFLLSSTHAYRLEKSGKLTSVPLNQTGEVLAFTAKDEKTAIISYTDRTTAVYFN